MAALEILESKVERRKNVDNCTMRNFIMSRAAFRLVRNGAVVTAVEMAASQDNSCEGRETIYDSHSMYWVRRSFIVMCTIQI
jgi:hypothetical protein